MTPHPRRAVTICKTPIFIVPVIMVLADPHHLSPGPDSSSHPGPGILIFLPHPLHALLPHQFQNQKMSQMIAACRHLTIKLPHGRCGTILCKTAERRPILHPCGRQRVLIILRGSSRREVVAGTACDLSCRIVRHTAHTSRTAILHPLQCHQFF